MSVAALSVSDPVRHLRRFARSPKGLLLAIFAVTGAVAAAAAGVSAVLPNLLVAAAVCAALDMAIVYLREDRLIFPDGAILTGLIIAFVLRPEEPLPVVFATAAIAILTKQVFRTRWSNIFNPAALALVISGAVFHSGQSWWGAMPDSGPLGIVLLLAAGLFIVDRTNKLPLVLAFLAGYFVLFTEASFLGSESLTVAEIFRSPDIQAVLFFAFFMVDDPPTCPVRYEYQVAFGLGAALVSYLVFLSWGAVYFLPAGLLVPNAAESARRVLFQHRAAQSRRKAPSRR